MLTVARSVPEGPQEYQLVAPEQLTAAAASGREI